MCLSANEDSYLLDGHETFESKYLSVQDDIAKNRKRYEFNDRLDWDEIQRTAEELEEADDLLLRGGIDIDALFLRGALTLPSSMTLAKTWA
jgi:hypothetical protein